ncbi:DeoR/GlpR family DNA-binding transcription regulator [Rhizobium terrae]|uniref:DeoR/GlpR family DNA-binding transcription regulator n=1 Tax=Rhizobium terrae TaxID=2171756 RepID=UPI000E3E5125|nr:DeoR/GlpR family DNA-binding transcription regulator [Rhizobium terrae]
MLRLTAAGRQRAIAKRITEQQGVRISSIAEDYGVSPETIRRDLLLLEKEGAIQRVYGGAIVADRGAPIQERIKFQSEGKAAIAKIVAKLVKPNQRVFISGGSSNLAIAHALRDAAPLFVTTNMPAIAEALQGPAEHRVFLTGGEYIHSSGVLNGSQTLASISDCVFDLSIIGAYGIDLKFGLVESSRENQQLKQSLIERSHSSIFVADSTKFGASGAFCSAPLSKAGTIVTDQMPSAEFADAFDRFGVRVIYPNKPGRRAFEVSDLEEEP